MMLVLGLLYHAAWGGVAYATFCRAHYLRPDTRIPVRIGVASLMSGAVWMCVTPLSGSGYSPAPTFLGVALCLFMTARSKAFRA